MSYSDVKEREARQDTEGEGTPPGTIDKKEDEAWFTEEKAWSMYTMLHCNVCPRLL